MENNIVYLNNIDVMSNELYDALSEAFQEELIRQGKDPRVSWQFWNISATYEPWED